MPKNTDQRRRALCRWLNEHIGLEIDSFEPASTDASFRRYFRVLCGETSYIAMDAPPPQEDCGPFVRIAGYLRDMGLNCPRVIAASEADGFLLLSDLGHQQYLGTLRTQPDCAERLYRDAIDALLTLQHAGRQYQSLLPPYDAALLRTELALFHDWLCVRHLDIDFSAADERHWRAVCDWLVDAALAQPRVFVHRDYHSRNLMVCDAANPGILDFQDAVEGPLTYDLVSLLKDCYLRWPADDVRRRALAFYAESSPADACEGGEAGFLRSFDTMGVQRHLKAAGIFARLRHRDGKDGYLADIPRTLGYIVELGGRYPQLDFLADLVASRCLPALGARA